MNFVNEFGEKRNGFAEVVAFYHVTCRYFDRFLLQGVDKNWRQACFFYLAPGLISEVYWQVKSRRSIFRIANPTYGICGDLYNWLCNYLTERKQQVVLNGESFSWTTVTSGVPQFCTGTPAL